MGLSTAEHAKGFSDALKMKSGGAVDISEIVTTPNGARSSFTLRIKQQDNPDVIKAEGLVVIRTVTGRDENYLLCMVSWRPNQPGVLQEGETICDSFSMGSSSPGSTR
jgi:hypothetical protein